MSKTLFPTTKIPDYLLDIEYKGPSFAGMMEIGALRAEITGLENAVRIIAQVLARHGRTDFNANDVQIFIEAFKKGSFCKKAKLFIKGLDKHPGALTLGILLIMILQTIPQYRADKIRDMPPQLVAEIGDQIKIELLKNDEFLKSLADIVRPLERGGDELSCAVPLHDQVVIKYEDKKEFLELTGEVEEEEINGERSEVLLGRINRVDLDARVRHIGFKVNNEGASIQATLVENLRNPTDMRGLLDRWIKLEGITTYQKGVRSHIEISKYKVIRQEEINFELNSESKE